MILNSTDIRCAADALDARLYEINVQGSFYLVRAHTQKDAEATAREAHEGRLTEHEDQTERLL